MSLGGLAIAIGMLVDALVVVVENIVATLSMEGRARLHRVQSFRSDARSQPVASGLLIIILVFVPLLTLQGLEGKLFIPVALRSSSRSPPRCCGAHDRAGRTSLLLAAPIASRG